MSLQARSLKGLGEQIHPDKFIADRGGKISRDRGAAAKNCSTSERMAP
jgi:hypothetical protein